MSVANEINAVQVFLTGTQPVSQPRTVSVGKSPEIDSAGYQQSNDPSKITIGTVPAPFLQGGLEKSGCRCGSCRECVSQAYSNQAKILSPGQPTTEQRSQTILPAESEEQNRPPLLPGGQKGVDGEPLSREELAQLVELKKRDRVVRAHEQAHMIAAAGLVTRGMSFSYQTGADGKKYAVGGEVQIDVGKEATPTATIAKMKKVQAAALAPAAPSAQDRGVAARAATKMSRARVELRVEQTEEIKTQWEEIIGEREEGKNDSSDGVKVDKSSTVSSNDKMAVPSADKRPPQNINISVYRGSRNTYSIPSQFHVQA